MDAAGQGIFDLDPQKWANKVRPYPGNIWGLDLTRPFRMWLRIYIGDASVPTKQSQEWRKKGMVGKLAPMKVSMGD